jgi:hypothetical protein
MDKPEFTLVPAANELCVYCTVALWYVDEESEGVPSRVYGVGGDKVLRVEKNGPFVSDEAYKGAYTDALGNAMKHIGVNADIHMGLFDDNKYVGAPTRPAEAPARSATNGGGTKAKHPKWDYAGARFREIEKAIRGAGTEKIVNEIWDVNGSDLDLIEELHEPSHRKLLELRNEMLAKLEPALTGEP